jgi:hypothetical protein
MAPHRASNMHILATLATILFEREQRNESQQQQQQPYSAPSVPPPSPVATAAAAAAAAALIVTQTTTNSSTAPAHGDTMSYDSDDDTGSADEDEHETHEYRMEPFGVFEQQQENDSEKSSESSSDEESQGSETSDDDDDNEYNDDPHSVVNEHCYDDGTSPYWMEPDWIPAVSSSSNGGKNGSSKQKTPHQIRTEMRRYMESKRGREKGKTALLSDLGVNSNSFRKFMDPHNYKDSWRASTLKLPLAQHRACCARNTQFYSRLLHFIFIFGTDPRSRNAMNTASRKWNVLGCSSVPGSGASRSLSCQYVGRHGLHQAHLLSSHRHGCSARGLVDQQHVVQLPAPPEEAWWSH